MICFLIFPQIQLPVGFVFTEERRAELKDAVIAVRYVTCSFRCVETEDEELITPCSASLLGVQVRKAFRGMTQKRAQLVLVSTQLKREKKM